MDENLKKNNLSKKEALDESFLDYLTGAEPKKKFEKIAEHEKKLADKITKILLSEYKFSKNQIWGFPKLEVLKDTIRPDLVVVDDKTQVPIIIVEFRILEKTSQTSKNQLTKHMRTINTSYGIIFDGEKLDCYQKINQVLIPIAKLPTKNQFKEKTYPISFDEKLAETIANNMITILRQSGFDEIESTLISLQILLVKSFDELHFNNNNFQILKNKPENTISTLHNLWAQILKNKIFTGQNYFDKISEDTAVQLCLFVENFSIKKSDVDSLFKSLMSLSSFSQIYSEVKTPQHLLEIMFKMALISREKKIHIVLTGTGDSIPSFLSFVKTNLKFLEDRINNYLEKNVRFSTQNRAIF